MNRSSCIPLILMTAVGAAPATVIPFVDLLDPSDGGTQPPPGVICIDAFIDASRDDVWVAEGLRGFVTPAGLADGVSIRYSSVPDDPNTIHFEYLLNPGIDERFVSFLTKPRGRDDDERYTNGAIGIANRYSPTHPLEIASNTELNVAWYADPPEGSNSPSVDGATARIALDVSTFLANHPQFEAFHVGLPASATGPILFQSTTNEGLPGTISVGFDHEQGINWAVWYTEVPEPSSAVFLSLGIVVFRRLQRLRG